MRLLRTLLLSLGVAFAFQASARADSQADVAESADGPRAHIELVADATHAPAEGDFRVGVRFVLEPGWHMYWHNPGESGLPTSVEFGGVEAGELQWPAPHRFETPGPIITYGYGDEVLLFATATPTGEGAVTVSAEVDFLVCEVACIPAHATLERTLERAEPGAAPTPSEHTPAFELAAAAVPSEAAALEVARNDTEGFVVDVACEDCDERPEFIPAFGVEIVTLREQSAESTDTGWRISFEPSDGTVPETLTGVLRLGEHGFVIDHPSEAVAEWVETATAETEATVEAIPSAAPTRASWLLAILFGLLGGLVLNLMPCVLPVLAVKVFGWVKAREEGEPPKRHAAFYALGVIGSMLVLGGVVLGLRAAGHEVGLGFQLQEPKFVAGLAILLAVMATSFFGVFEVRLNANALSRGVDDKHGAARSIGEGVLTVVLATPCSAPMLSVAVGFAFTGSAFEVLSVFASIGLGLALPFLLLARFPSMGKFLPKPGLWMEKLQRVLGFALLATAVWLAWVFGSLTSLDGMAMLVGLLVICTFAVWMLSSWGKKALVVALPLVALAALPVWRAQPVPGAAHTTEVEGWTAWSPEAVSTELAAGKTAVIVFTADWCLTCKLNERVAFGDDDVRARLANEDVALFVGDWTARDDAIRAELARHGRASVPLVLVQSPGGSPNILPELLSPNDVLEALPSS